MDPVGAKDPDFKDSALYIAHTLIQVAPNTDTRSSVSTTATETVTEPTGPDTRSRSGASTVTPAPPSDPLQRNQHVRS